MARKNYEVTVTETTTYKHYIVAYDEKEAESIGLELHSMVRKNYELEPQGKAVTNIESIKEYEIKD